MARTTDIESFFRHCRSLPGVTEDVKWSDNLIFSVGGKMFAGFDLPDGEPFSFKVSDEAFELLTQHEGVRPAPYLARASWIQVYGTEILPAETVLDLLTEAHALVASKLTKKLRAELGI